MLARRLRAISGNRPLTLISSSSNQNTASSTDVAISKPASVQSGDLLVAVLSVQSGTAPADNIWSSSGWTRRFDTAGRAVLTLTAGASEPSSYTFTASGISSTHQGWIFCFRNATWGGVNTISALGNPRTLTNVTGLTNAYGVMVANATNQASATYSQNDGTYTSLATDSDATQPSSALWYKNNISESGTPTVTGPSNFRLYFFYLNPV